MNLVSSFLFMALVFGIKIQLVKPAKSCIWCHANDPRACQGDEIEMKCTHKNSKAAAKHLGKFFINDSNIKPKGKQYNCFAIDLLTVNKSSENKAGADSFLRFKSCIHANIGVCSLLPKSELNLQKTACIECVEDKCNSNNLSNIDFQLIYNLKGEDKADGEKLTHIEAYSIVFCIIILLATIMSAIAWVIAKKICQPSRTGSF